jgi:hypothetical protein
MPLSDFVPDVTLIAFPIPGARPRAVAEHLLHANRPGFVSRKCPDSDVEANSGANLNSLRFGPFGVLDGCSLPRNQWRYQNLLIH